MAARAAKARKRRQIQTGIGAGAAVLLVLVGAVWLVTNLSDDDPASTAGTSPTSAAPTGCQYTPDDVSANPNLKDVGTPPANEPRTGKQRSEEHTSELQSLRHLVCRLLLEK